MFALDWRPVVGYEQQYLVSNLGDVLRVKGRVHVMRAWKHPCGYLAIRLRRPGVTNLMLVHRVVAEAFIGPRPDGYEVNHLDGVKTNNFVSNLEYVTRSENMKHANALGLIDHSWRRGERLGWTKLTEARVLEIRMSNESSPVLGRRFGVSDSAIRDVRRGRSWSDLVSV